MILKKTFYKLTMVLACAVLAAMTIMMGIGCVGQGAVVSIAVYTRPTQETVAVGDTPNLSGGYILVTHARGEPRIVSMTDNGVTSNATPILARFRHINITVTYRRNSVQVPFAIADAVEGMHLTWSDEFFGDTINENNWEFQIGTGSQGPNNPWGNREMQFYRRENASIQDGYLTINGLRQNVIFRWLGSGNYDIIYVTDLPLEELCFDTTPELAGIDHRNIRTIRRESPWLGGQMIDGTWQSGTMVGQIFMAEYTSSRMRTHERFYQTFGRFEARMSIPAFPGSWNAFWMMPEQNIFPTGGVWPRSGEIDIMENRGNNPDYAGQAVHFAIGNPGQHRMQFNDVSSQQRLRVCETNERAFTTYASYVQIPFVEGMVRGVDYAHRRFNHCHDCRRLPNGTQPSTCFVLTERIDYHFHTYRIDWRPESMVWYIGYYDDIGDKIWHEVFRLTNWRQPTGNMSDGWTDWGAGAANTIAGAPTSGPLFPGGPGVGSLNTAYILTRRDSAPFDHNFHLILNMAIGGQFDPGVVWQVPDDLNVNTRIDYVRAWQFDDLVPLDATVSAMPTQETFAHGSRPNLAGGEIDFLIYEDGNYIFYTIAMNDPRIVVYGRTLQQHGTNVPIYLDFRGYRVRVVLPTVSPPLPSET